MLEIVTHCWSGSAVPIYHRLLQIQFSSLLKYPSSVPVTITVCYCGEDTQTKRVVEWFADELKSRNGLTLQHLKLEEKYLFRRAIGRNIAARATNADVVWFTDCDHCFVDECLRQAHDYCLMDEKNMIWPQYVNVHKTHYWGDLLLQKVQEYGPPFIVELDRHKFYARHERRAWGGLQIVKGEWCRDNGYLDNTKWQKPVNPAEGFRSCKGDVPFRKQVGGSAPWSIEGVYRIRHSRAGRDGGSVDHGAK